MGPGLVVRRYSIPDVVSIRLEGTAELARPEWVARASDPPLPKEVPIEVDFWRPAAQGSDERRWPEIDVPTAGKLAGLIGFRRPSDWSGRLEPRGGIEPASELSFARAWGGLPDDGLTLAGAARYGRSAALDVETRPVPLHRSIRTKVVASPSPGRLNASIEGILTDRQGRSFDTEVTIPNDLRLVRVEADGLLDWQKVARDRLRLQFDGAGSMERAARSRSMPTLPAPADSLMSETRTYQAKVPWPQWVDAEPTSGTIEVASSTRFQFEQGEGTVRDPDCPAGGIGIGPPVVVSSGLALRDIDGALVRPPLEGERRGRQRAGDRPDELDVDSRPDLRSLRPVRPSRLELELLPTEWAEGATLEIEGMTHRLVSQANGPKAKPTRRLDDLSPDPPIWGKRPADSAIDPDRSASGASSFIRRLPRSPRRAGARLVGSTWPSATLRGGQWKSPARRGSSRSTYRALTRSIRRRRHRSSPIDRPCLPQS